MNVDLTGVERTTLLPLWGRYAESLKSDGLIRDEACLRMVDSSGIDLSGISASQSPATQLAWAARAFNLDWEIRNAVGPAERATVLCLGCGLDTAYRRLGLERLRWYDVDLPSVLELRRKLLPEQEHCIMKEGSVLDPRTFASVEVEGPLVVTAAGILYYFTEDEVKTVFDNIASLGRKAVVIIDFCSAKGIELSNRTVVNACTGARMIWSAERDDDIVRLHPSITSIRTYPLFDKVLPRLDEARKSMASMSDSLRIMSFAVLTMEP